MLISKLHDKKTKIVATIGPASNSPDVLRGMIREGMDVARINFSHGNHEQHAQAISLIRKIAEEEGAVVGVLADLQGPKIRLGVLDPDPYPIKPGDQLVLTNRPNPDQSKGHLPLPHPDFINDLEAGNRLLLDDGEIELLIRAKTTNDDLQCEVVFGHKLKSRKGVASPDAVLKSLSVLADKDRDDVRFAIEQGVDFIAMSFVRNADDMRELRWLVRHHRGDVWLIAKIEKFDALQHIESILEHSDGIMVARGDLGVEIPAAEVPIQQKRIIRRCNELGKPVITATQMLQSMIEAPRPTRAEANDVANAIFDGTDAVMLSGESATGKYPLESVKTMAEIARIAEQHLRDTNHSRMSATQGGTKTVADAITHATREIALSVGAKIIITSTWTGYSARRVARERPPTPILSVTPNRDTFYRSTLIWGCLPVLIEPFDTIDEMIEKVLAATKHHNLVEIGDVLVIIAGVPFGAGGQTNFVKVHQVGTGI